jgi:anti-anti-sigma factor
MPGPTDIARNGATPWSHPAGPGALIVETRWRGDVAIARPSGELDLATVETLRSAFDTIGPASRLVLDLRGLSFIDSSGLHLLAALDLRTKRDGIQLSLIAPPPPVDRPIRLWGFDRALPFLQDTEDLGDAA